MAIRYKFAEARHNRRVCHILLFGFTCLGSGFLLGQYTGTSGVARVVKAEKALLSRISSGFTQSNALLCSDTCAKAKDGVCDDGRGPGDPGSILKVKCDLGTDCTDCGLWDYSGPIHWGDTAQQAPPIKLLMDKGVAVRVRNTTTTAPFMFAYTDPKRDIDVSQGLELTGAFEPQISKIFYKILKDGCLHDQNDPDSRALFVDVGANFGWFTIIAALLGCRVLAFEPVPHFRAFLEYNVHINNLSHLVEIRTQVVSHLSGVQMEILIPNQGMWGTAGIGGHNIDKDIKSDIEKLMVDSVRIQDIVQEDALLMKVDVEGWEWSVIKGADSLLKKYNVKNIVLEYSPGVHERTQDTSTLISSVKMLITLVGLKYRLGYINDNAFTAAIADTDWGHQLPAMPEVTLHNLKYDLYDAINFKDTKMGCPAPNVLNSTWGCNLVPEDHNPRSFRSVLGHRGNVWASKEGGSLVLGQPTGIFKLDDPANKYFIDDGAKFGQGHRPCESLTPKVQVRHRCPCTVKAECGAEEEIVKKLAAEGNMPNNYVLG